jgi:RHS repeat-associated protein
MPVVNYHTVNGQMVGQSTGSTFTQYLTDALGSVTATVNGKRVTNTYRYKPYGESLAKTGTGADPDFQWTGDTGSRVTGRSRAEQYNRARHYGTSQASWTSVDPIWPRSLAYIYVEGDPVHWIDPSGHYRIERKKCGTADYVEIDKGQSSSELIGPTPAGSFLPPLSFDPRAKERGIIPEESCVCHNAGYFGGLPMGRMWYPNCGSSEGRNFGGYEERPKTDTGPGRDRIPTVIVRTDLGWIEVRKTEPGRSNIEPRTFVCLDQAGRVSRSFVIGRPPGIRSDDFVKCISCPPGHRLQPLDGGGSTQLVEFPCRGNGRTLIRSDDESGVRPLPNMICYCKPCPGY